MSLSNPWLLLALVGTLVVYHLELLATWLNLSALSDKIPKELEASVSEEDHHKSLEYARVSANFDVLHSTCGLFLFYGFWFFGGFGKVDEIVRGFHLNPIWAGLAVIGIIVALTQMLELPFSIYETFVIEQRFGFNKTTIGTFIMDRIKGLGLALLLGVPMVALLLWLFAKFELAALYGWILVSGFSLLMSWLAPRLILPLFFKFQPLGDASLQAAIMDLSNRVDFPVADVSVVDGSRRSTKANAFFTGFGKLKRIALFDTLLQHSQQEILAVLAHEVGHFKRKHVPKQIVLSLSVSALLFALLHFALRDPRLCAAFGVSEPSIAWGLVFFGIIYQPVSMVLGWIGGHLSRKYEFEADAFARQAMNGPEPMASVLMKLSRDHLSNPTPHPFYVFLHYSHPPVLQRLAALRG
jgi:STE24 endopeptidase